MRLLAALSHKLFVIAVKGAVLGTGLAAAFPTENVNAACDCDDHDSGTYRCASGNASSCSAGTQVCDVTCGGS